MKYIFDWSLENQLFDLIFVLCKDPDTECFFLADSSTDYSKIEDVLKYLGNCHYFIAPQIEKKMECVAWKANTIRSIRPKLYIGSDADTVEQARLLGVPSALYRL